MAYGMYFNVNTAKVLKGSDLGHGRAPTWGLRRRSEGFRHSAWLYIIADKRQLTARLKVIRVFDEVIVSICLLQL